MSPGSSIEDLEERRTELKDDEHDTDIDEVRDFYESICETIDNKRLEAGGSKYRFLANLQSGVDDDIILELCNSADERDCVRLTALHSCISPFRRHSDRDIRMVRKHQEEFEGQTLYRSCRFWAYSRSDDPVDLRDAFLDGITIADQTHDDSSLYVDVAAVGARLVRQSNSSVLEIRGKSVDEESILSECAKYAEKAYSAHPHHRGPGQTYASVLALQGHYDDAIDILKQYNHNEDDSYESIDPFANAQQDRLISKIQQDKQRHEFDTLSDDLAEIESELEGVTERYRSQILQFIGFFAAILTIALSSVNIATELSFPQSGGLILILVGGITISFGELDALFNESEKGWSSNLRTTVVGVILIFVGIAIGTGGLQILSNLISL